MIIEDDLKSILVQTLNKCYYYYYYYRHHISLSRPATFITITFRNDTEPHSGGNLRPTQQSPQSTEPSAARDRSGFSVPRRFLSPDDSRTSQKSAREITEHLFPLKTKRV